MGGGLWGPGGRGGGPDPARCGSPVVGPAGALVSRRDVMQKARVNGHLVVAGPDAPEVAWCPCCGWVVVRRKRRKQDGGVTYFWRHKVGGEDGCPLRYHPDSG